MIWNTIPNEERLRLWKKLRDDITGLSLDKQLAGVSKFCSQMPIGSRSIDYYTPDDWPTPWEILFHGSFCTSSISLLMYYTLTLVDPTQKVELYLVEDPDGVFLLPVINDHFLLNYELGKVNSVDIIKNDTKILKIYTSSDIKEIR